jgi:hypothetical protein
VSNSGTPPPETEQAGVNEVQDLALSGQDLAIDVTNEAVRPRKRRISPEILVVSGAIALGLTLVFFGLTTATTGRDALRYPDAIVDISPAPNDRQVLSQTEILVDLADGFEAVLVLDGIELPVTRLEEVAGLLAKPGQQIELPPTAIYDQGNSLIRFEPRSGALIERYQVGVHQAKVIYWKIEEGRQASRSYSWSFEVL